MIEEKLESLIELYTLEIEDETKNLKKYKDALENILKESDCLSEVDNSRICSLHRIVDRMANEIFMMKRFLLDLKTLMLPRKEYKEPLYRLRQNEYYILLMFEGNLGNKPINRYVYLSEIKKYGLFRNVPDNVSINDILANCEVIR